MPETPDFNQIARDIVYRVESHVHDVIQGEDDPVRETVIRQIAEQLRQIWNAAIDAVDANAETTDFQSRHGYAALWNVTKH